MTKQEIIEGNLIIAKWMRYKQATFEQVKKDFIMSCPPGSGYEMLEEQEVDLSEYWNIEYDIVRKNDQFYYHKSWDDLMEVIEKIGTMKFPDDTYKDTGTRIYIERCYPYTFGAKSEDGQYMFRLLAHQLFTADTLIEAAWLGVIDFIKNYKKGFNGTERNIRRE